ncbi:MAG: hypothetical protein H6Q90_4828 [Deltaproteobacteria bacterium]|nr:hypothetical protein [Deltaproteobacteria bacterium]
MPATTTTLAQRLSVFLRAGLVRQIPSRWQQIQGTVEMAPYVASLDATEERWYRGALLGHPVLRQPLILSQVGIDHLRIGSGLGAKLESVCRHLQLTHHRGMPVFDLQVIQTHPGGLEVLRLSLEASLAEATPKARRQNRVARLILPRASVYYERFLGTAGWIARAERLDYPEPPEEGSRFPSEFFSLAGFLNHCAAAFPASLDELPLHAVLAHLARLAGRRARERRRQG